jgi:hypothetical protein
VELYDYDDSLCGFSVNLTDGTIPYGYINLDFNAENIITEFAIEKNVDGLTSEILSDSDINGKLKKNLSKHAKLYKRLPFEYAVSLDNDNNDILYDQFRGKISKKEFQSARGNVDRKNKKNVILLKGKDDLSSEATKVSGWNHVIVLDTADIPSGLTNIDPIKMLSSKSSISASWSESNVGKYACSVQAMYNVADQLGYKVSGNNVKTYNFLWDKSGTTETSESKKDKKSNIQFGTTTDSKIQTALVALAKDQGYTKSSCATSSSPTYATFKNAVNSGKSSILSMHTVFKDDTKHGHSVSVVGYFSAKNKSGKVYKYIYVANGWDAGSNGFKYICISNTGNFTSLYSTVLTIKK